jgi:hypothetical protein
MTVIIDDGGFKDGEERGHAADLDTYTSTAKTMDALHAASME